MYSHVTFFENLKGDIKALFSLTPNPVAFSVVRHPSPGDNISGLGSNSKPHTQTESTVRYIASLSSSNRLEFDISVYPI